jgi:acetolactate synthase-1/2/3 large subunit
LHGGELIVDTLVGHGVSHVFGMPGGQANAFYAALAARRDRITHVLVRDERTAAYAADAFARVSNTIGVCDATVGPGAVKFPSGLMEAYNSSVPILAIVSDHPRTAVLLQDRGRISQGGDQLSVLRPFTKEVFTAPSTGLIPDVVAAAIHTAITGRPGPVAVQIPQDVFSGTSDVRARTGDGRFPKLRCTPSRVDVERAAALLAASRRPFILAGGGVHLSGAYAELGRLADTLRAAVATTISGKGAIAETHPLALGVIGDFGNPLAKGVADQADVILSVGYKNSQMASYQWTVPQNNQTLIQVDIDPAELGRVTTPAVSLWGDARETLELLSAELADRASATDSDWNSVIGTARNKWRALVEREGAQSAEPIWPQAVAGIIDRARDDDDYLIFDASFSSGWGAAFIPSRQAGRKMLFPRGAAGLGFSVPAALGVAMAAPGSRIICLAGDGASGYFIGELATVAGLGLALTCVVLNNSVLAWSKWSQRLNPQFAGENQSVELSEVDFGQVAQGLGLEGSTVVHLADFESALAAGLESRRPNLISVVSDAAQVPSASYREAMEQKDESKRSEVTY